jgi:high-affinity iron transporter
MLATFIIGLREGLEAALIVAIIATFLRNQGEGLWLMWAGVAAALTLSLGVGLGLALIEAALPQRTQEAMEALIGAVAVVFVTGMVTWMARHARAMKGELETQAASALGHGGRWALAGMAFLAVLREGFETSVFLLATFSAAQSGAQAALGALLGIATAVAIGFAIAQGGMRLNLGRFFRWSGVFLILVAAGLVLQALRSAHEAGWLLAGQQRIADLGWLVAPGSVQSALITGVMGIPADPRLIEGLGWLAYLIPVLVITYLPERWTRARRIAIGWRTSMAGALGACSVALALALPVPDIHLPDRVALVAQSDGTKLNGPLTLKHNALERRELRLPLSQAAPVLQSHLGVQSQFRALDSHAAITDAPAQIDLAKLAQLSGGRLPVGISPARNPGPFSARWQRLETVKLWTAQSAILDAQGKASMLLTLSGGGLTTPRSLRLDRAPDGAALTAWAVAPDRVQQAATALRSLQGAQIEYRFWARKLPLGLIFVAVALLMSALRRRFAPQSFNAAKSA